MRFGPEDMTPPPAHNLKPRKHRKTAASIVLSGNCTVRFEDHGQDFLEWDIVDKKVVACRPAQSWLWVGFEVLNLPEVGGQIMIRKAGHDASWIKYRLTEVRVLKSEAEPA
jgi:hypothetical protein